MICPNFSVYIENLHFYDDFLLDILYFVCFSVHPFVKTFLHFFFPRSPFGQQVFGCQSPGCLEKDTNFSFFIFLSCNFDTSVSLSSTKLQSQMKSTTYIHRRKVTPDLRIKIVKCIQEEDSFPCFWSKIKPNYWHLCIRFRSNVSRQCQPKSNKRSQQKYPGTN